MINLEREALKQTEVSNLQDIEASTKLKRCFALKQRHQAFGLVNLLFWSVCQKWLDKLTSALFSDAPSNFGASTRTQVMRSDIEMFQFWPQSTKGRSKQHGPDLPLVNHLKGLFMTLGLMCSRQRCRAKQTNP